MPLKMPFASLFLVQLKQIADDVGHLRFHQHQQTLPSSHVLFSAKTFGIILAAKNLVYVHES